MARSRLIRADETLICSLDKIRTALKAEGYKGSYTEATALLNFKDGVDNFDRDATRALIEIRRAIFNGHTTNEARRGGKKNGSNTQHKYHL